MQRHGWTLLFHDNLIEQMLKLRAAVLRAQERDPQGFANNANVKFFRALVQLIQEGVPSDPGRDEFRQGNTLGPAYRHWRRAKLGRRYRLFFRYDSKSKTIIYAWINDEHSLRSAGSQSDPYALFEKMLGRGNPPDDWDSLIAASQQGWQQRE
ncbi:Toxin YhaV [Delftia tsuruhatensis]|uniref:type II toxin-antitoxin system YhaV family toxin n=1 Tax=Delftia tsuruhatensis TaxID=180282 RepID=UPI001E7A8559|nr:type II toxin-antitoxin system YhaV family toxin [Delftia tsuruhatensis]CAB5671300.1 Toxin YhaV [Delftia tsuruhatensis]CAC9683189.1 Toxin YhaV [Delftia tsuruhatensis]